MEKSRSYEDVLSHFKPVSLDDIGSLRLMRRFDSKYLLPIQHLSEFLSRLKESYQVLEIKGKRSFIYDTTYFDSQNLKCYMDHQNRRKKRFKIREREYIINGLRFLEVKMKNNKGITVKKRMLIESETSLFDEKKEFVKSLVNLDLSELNETVSNSFHRINLISFETKERITIDYDLKYSYENKNIFADYYAIIEVKREHENRQTPVNAVLKTFRLQSRSFSKYCMSLALLKPGIKRNTFKPNILYLNRMRYDECTS
ncbi:MAG: polyphosphate polymerase domain-containing protein [Bacteroidota bacterium]|nr:polyphosphate polymerase domain-containing protein [Bacteroidota bacterium]